MQAAPRWNRSCNPSAHHSQKSWNFASETGPPSCINSISKRKHWGWHFILIIYFAYSSLSTLNTEAQPTLPKATAPRTTLLMLCFKRCRIASSSAAIWLNHKHLNRAMWEVWCNSLALKWSVSAILHCYSIPYIKGLHLNFMQNYSLCLSTKYLSTKYFWHSLTLTISIWQGEDSLTATRKSTSIRSFLRR